MISKFLNKLKSILFKSKAPSSAPVVKAKKSVKASTKKTKAKTKSKSKKEDSKTIIESSNNVSRWYCCQ